MWLDKGAGRPPQSAREPILALHPACSLIPVLAQEDKPWAPRPTEEPEFANEPPALEEAFRSVTDTDPWERARLLMKEHGMSMQEVRLPPCPSCKGAPALRAACPRLATALQEAGATVHQACELSGAVLDPACITSQNMPARQWCERGVRPECKGGVSGGVPSPILIEAAQ